MWRTMSSHTIHGRIVWTDIISLREVLYLVFQSDLCTIIAKN